MRDRETVTPATSSTTPPTMVSPMPVGHALFSLTTVVDLSEDVFLRAIPRDRIW